MVALLFALLPPSPNLADCSPQMAGCSPFTAATPWDPHLQLSYACLHLALRRPELGLRLLQRVVLLLLVDLQQWRPAAQVSATACCDVMMTVHCAMVSC